ncbi:MAG: hypothetical protein VX589_18520, partial [Myxococcota bacterium]|nr:hypothetical protein [Myxococcota bacterium]
MRLSIETHDKFDRYALGLLSRFCGVRFHDEGPFDVRLDHETSDGFEGPKIPRVTAYSPSNLPNYMADAKTSYRPKRGDPFLFDIFRAIKFWLTDMGHGLGADAFDDHGRLRGAFSVQATHFRQSVPIVNAYMQQFRQWLESQFSIECRRNRCRVILSHDVDAPLDSTDLGHSAWTAGAALLARHPRTTLGQIRHFPALALKRARGEIQRNWHFADIVALEARHGMTSTFYFASTPWWWPGAHPRDVKYDVRAPKFRKVMNYLRQAGAEVGLHMSYNVCDRPGLLEDETARLARSYG